MGTALPELPPHVKRVTLSVAEQIVAALQSCGLSPANGDDIPSGYLYTILYLLRNHCLNGETVSNGSDDLISLSTIAETLDKLAEGTIRGEAPELAGLNAAWYQDAAAKVSHSEAALEHQIQAIDLLLEKGLGERTGGTLRYPSEGSGWQIGDIEVDDYLERYRNQRVMLLVVPLGD